MLNWRKVYLLSSWFNFNPLWWLGPRLPFREKEYPQSFFLRVVKCGCMKVVHKISGPAPWGKQTATGSRQLRPDKLDNWLKDGHLCVSLLHAEQGSGMGRATSKLSKANTKIHNLMRFKRRICRCLYFYLKTNFQTRSVYTIQPKVKWLTVFF